MAKEFKVSRQRGGNHHPISVGTFILDHLAANGEDYIANMHRAYKMELDRLSQQNGRIKAYHKPRYHSFEMAVQNLAREGLVMFSGKEEESDSPQFASWDIKPMRRFYRVV